jgi:hypothetical protein
MSGQMNLHNIGQNSGEQVAILKLRRHVSFTTNSQTKIGYFLDHPELDLLGSHRLCGYEGYQGEVLPQPASVWSRRGSTFARKPLIETH